MACTRLAQDFLQDSQANTRWRGGLLAIVYHVAVTEVAGGMVVTELIVPRVGQSQARGGLISLVVPGVPVHHAGWGSVLGHGERGHTGVAVPLQRLVHLHIELTALRHEAGDGERMVKRVVGV